MIDLTKIPRGLVRTMAGDLCARCRHLRSWHDSACEDETKGGGQCRCPRFTPAVGKPTKQPEKGGKRERR